MHLLEPFYYFLHKFPIIVFQFWAKADVIPNTSAYMNTHNHAAENKSAEVYRERTIAYFIIQSLYNTHSSIISFSRLDLILLNIHMQEKLHS